jgi:hypothetical protein
MPCLALRAQSYEKRALPTVDREALNGWTAAPAA